MKDDTKKGQTGRPRFRSGDKVSCNIGGSKVYYTIAEYLGQDRETGDWQYSVEGMFGVVINDSWLTREPS